MRDPAGGPVRDLVPSARLRTTNGARLHTKPRIGYRHLRQHHIHEGTVRLCSPFLVLERRFSLDRELDGLWRKRMSGVLLFVVIFGLLCIWALGWPCLVRGAGAMGLGPG